MKFSATAASTWTHLPGTFYLYEQLNDHYCVPASLQSIMRYLTGYADTQGNIAKAVGTLSNGTVFSNALPYLNNNQNKNLYVAKTYVPIETMKSDFNAAIGLYKSPPLLAIHELKSLGFPDNLDSHALVLNAKSDDLAEFQLADPWVNYAKLATNVYYKVSADNLYTAIQYASFQGYMY